MTHSSTVLDMIGATRLSAGPYSSPDEGVASDRMDVVEIDLDGIFDMTGRKFRNMFTDDLEGVLGGMEV